MRVVYLDKMYYIENIVVTLTSIEVRVERLS